MRVGPVNKAGPRGHHLPNVLGTVTSWLQQGTVTLTLQWRSATLCAHMHSTLANHHLLTADTQTWTMHQPSDEWLEVGFFCGNVTVTITL